MRALTTHRRLSTILCAAALLVVIAPAVASAQGTMFVNNDRVGIHTATPGFDLHLQKDSGRARFESTNAAGALKTVVDIMNDGPPGLLFRDNSTGTTGTWFFRMGTAGAGSPFIFANNGVAGTEFRLNPGGNLTILGTITTAGSCSVGCDAVFQPEYDLESIEEHSDYMWSNSHLPGVGPTPENGPFNLPDKTGRILNELEKAHIYIDQLHQRLEALEQKLADG